MADSHYRTGGYIKRLPKDPWGNDYQYLSPGEKGCLMFIPGSRWSGKREALAQISVTGICRSFSNQCLNADSRTNHAGDFPYRPCQCGRGTDVCDRFRAACEKSAQDFLTRFARFKTGQDRRATLGVLIDPPGYQLCSVVTGNGCPFCDPLSAQLRCRNRMQMQPEVISGRRNMRWSCSVVA